VTVTPTFTGQRAVLLHRPGETTEQLGRQLGLLGLRVEIRWAPLDFSEAADVVLVDADEGWSELLPWKASDKPAPLIALLGSEAPGRIAWALDRGADALIAKPVALSAVYPALVMAARRFAEARATADQLTALRERIRLRPIVLGAVQHLMVLHGWTEDDAYRHLRREAMSQRLALEQAAASILAGARTRAG
jgi:AmiR/NasT family two-component response regulator